MREYLLVLVVAAAVTYVATPLVRTLAVRLGAMKPVRDRDVHAAPVPRLGGTAMFLGFAAALLVASRLPHVQQVFALSRDPAAVLLGAGLVSLLGVADDLWELDAVTKLAGQVLAAGVMAFQGVQLLQLPVFGVTVLPTPVLVSLTVVIVVGTMNAVNFIDGLDGLAAGVVAIAALTFFAYSYLLASRYAPNVFSSSALVTAAAVGCCAGFLPHNFHPARIFMGDSGSMLLGLLLSASTISLTSNVDPSSLPSGGVTAPAWFPVLLPVAVLLVPLVDLLLAVARRTRAGRKPWHPDAQHLHHQLLRLGHTHARAVLVMYLWTAVLSLGAASFAVLPLAAAGALLTVAVGVAVVLTAFGPRWHRDGRATA